MHTFVYSECAVLVALTVEKKLKIKKHVRENLLIYHYKKASLWHYCLLSKMAVAKTKWKKMGENKERLRKKEKMRVWGAILTRLKKTQNAILNWFFSNMKANDCVQRYPKSF